LNARGRRHRLGRRADGLGRAGGRAPADAQDPRPLWEGSGNVNALDVLRALAKENGRSEILHAFHDELALSRRAPTPAWTASLSACARSSRTSRPSSRARGVWWSALALQGSLLVRHAPAAVADAFCASRLAGDGGLSYGTLPPGVDARAIVERHLPPA